MKSTLSSTQKARSKAPAKSKVSARLAKSSPAVPDSVTTPLKKAARKPSRGSRPKQVKAQPIMHAESVVLETRHWMRLLAQCLGLLLFVVLWIQSASRELKGLFDVKGRWLSPDSLGDLAHLAMPLAVALCYAASFTLVRLLARRRLAVSEQTLFWALTGVTFSLLWAI